jgi:hypothetical protein
MQCRTEDDSDFGMLESLFLLGFVLSTAKYKKTHGYLITVAFTSSCLVYCLPVQDCNVS